MSCYVAALLCCFVSCRPPRSQDALLLTKSTSLNEATVSEVIASAYSDGEDKDLVNFEEFAKLFGDLLG